MLPYFAAVGGGVPGVRFQLTLLWMISAACLTSCQPLPPAENSTAYSASRTTVRLASWNLEHLAEANGTGCRPRSDADYAELRQHAAALEADVVALQEVESVEAAYRVFPREQWTIILSERPHSSRSEPCRENPSQSVRRQDVGFAIRRGIPFRSNAELRSLGLGSPDLRWGVDVTLDLPRPIRLLSIHLKSGCNIDRESQDADCDVIFRQGAVLESWIDARAAAGEDFAILGDWNRRTAGPGDQFMRAISDDDPPGGRIVMADADRNATCLARFRDFIDHIGLGESAARRVIANSFQEYTYEGQPEEDFPSDHCPVTVELQSR
jgi:endonuclease/exonuclease/phosphatase family metal-dependent hydrolase